MSRTRKLTAALSLALLGAQAQAVEFSFLSAPVTPEAFGNAYAVTVEGLTLRATAWSTTGRGGTLQSAELEIYPGYGMGVCSRREGVNCSASNNGHALDNNGADDLILFSFSAAVKLGALNLQQFGGDSDLSLWAGTGQVDPNGRLPAALGTAVLVDNASSANTLRTVSFAGALNGSYDWLAVAARVGQNNDYAKLRGLTVEPVALVVSESQSWALMLAGLGMVGYAVRRRTG